METRFTSQMLNNWLNCKVSGVSLIAIGLVSVGVFLVLHVPHGTVEPVYQGRRLTCWLLPLKEWPFGGLLKPVPTSDGPYAGADDKRAGEALGSLGTNSIPFLLDLFRHRSSPFKEAVNHLLKKQSLLTFRFAREPDYPQLARKAFRKLGLRGRVAIPGLIRLFGDKDENEAANVCETLCRMLPESAPALITALTNENKLVRERAASCLGGHIGAISAIPALKLRLQDNSLEVRLAAADSLASLWIPHIDKIVVPVFQQSLRARNWQTRLGAACSLDSHHTIARAAIPDLIKALKDNSVKVRIASARALLDISQGAAHEAGVWYGDSDPSPELVARKGFMERLFAISLVVTVAGTVVILRLSLVGFRRNFNHKGSVDGSNLGTVSAAAYSGGRRTLIPISVGQRSVKGS